MNTINTFVLNIETIPDPELEPELSVQPPNRNEIRAPANYKDPEKISEYIERAYQQAVQEMDKETRKLALHPLTSRVICVGTMINANQPIVHVSDSEVSLLEELRDLLDPLSQDIQLITYNGKAFDIPTLISSSVRLGIKWENLNPFSLLRKYYTYPHFDVYEAMSSFGISRKGTLKEWAIRLKCGEVYGDGEMVYDWWTAGDTESIANHCSSNLKSTYEIYKHIINTFPNLVSY